MGGSQRGLAGRVGLTRMLGYGGVWDEAQSCQGRPGRPLRAAEAGGGRGGARLAGRPGRSGGRRLGPGEGRRPGEMAEWPQRALSALGALPGLFLSRYQRVPAAPPDLCPPVPEPPRWLPLPVPAGPDPPPGRQDLHPAPAQGTKCDHCRPPGPLSALAAAPYPEPQGLLPGLGRPPAGPRGPERSWPGLVPRWLHPAEWRLHR